MKYLGCRKFKDKTAERKDVRIVKFYFSAKKGGLARFEFDSINVFGTGMESSLRVQHKTLVLPGLKFRVRVLPVLQEENTTVIRNHNTGGLVKKTQAVHYYSGLEINYQKFQPLPDDFDDLIKQICSCSGISTYEPLKTQLEDAGLLSRSSHLGDYATTHLEKHKDELLKAIAKAEELSEVASI
jgi:hypothetical protein